MQGFEDIFADVFEDIFGETSEIAKDLTKANNLNKDKIGKAITTKLNFSYCTEIEEFIDSTIFEIKEFVIAEIEKTKGSIQLDENE